MTPRDRNNLEEARHHLVILQQHLTRGVLNDPLIVDAVCMRLMGALEALGRFDQDRRLALFGPTWHEMASTRNRLAHAYDRIELDVIAATIEQDVPPLIQVLEQAIQESDHRDGAVQQTPEES